MARHFDIIWIQFDTDETATEAERYQTGCAAAAERIEDRAWHRVFPVNAMGTPAHRVGPWKRAVVGLTRLTASMDIGQHSPPAGLRINRAPLSLVVDGDHAGFE